MPQNTRPPKEHGDDVGEVPLTHVSGMACGRLPPKVGATRTHLSLRIC